MLFQDTGNNYSKDVICKAHSDPAMPPKWETVDKHSYLGCLQPCQTTDECIKPNSYCAKLHSDHPESYCIPPCPGPENAVVVSSSDPNVNSKSRSGH